MKQAVIKCKSKQEAAAIEAAMRMPDVRALVLVAGYLAPFDASAKRRMLRYVEDRFASAKKEECNAN